MNADGRNVSDPVGVVGVLDVSVTVAVHEVVCPRSNVVGVQATVVVVVCKLPTATVAVLELTAWVVSPP